MIGIDSKRGRAAFLAAALVMPAANVSFGQEDGNLPKLPPSPAVTGSDLKSFFFEGPTSDLRKILFGALVAYVVQEYRHKKKQKALTLGQDMGRLAIHYHHLLGGFETDGVVAGSMGVREISAKERLDKIFDEPAVSKHFRQAMSEVSGDTCVIPLKGQLGRLCKDQLGSHVSGKLFGYAPEKDIYLLFPVLEDPRKQTNDQFQRAKLIIIRERDLKAYEHPEDLASIRVEKPANIKRIFTLHRIAKAYYGGTLTEDRLPVRRELPVIEGIRMGDYTIDWKKIAGSAGLKDIGEYLNSIRDAGDLPKNVPISPSKTISLESVRSILEASGISTDNWGSNATKTLSQLVEELREGEARLIEDQKYKVLRHVGVINADVRYTTPEGEHLRLKVLKQVFNDGSERTRDKEDAVSEKMKPFEMPLDCALRGIQEELKLKGKIDITELSAAATIRSSPSFPGLTSRYERHKFLVNLSDAQYKSEGYVHPQDDKTTFFVWEKAPGNGDRPL